MTGARAEHPLTRPEGAGTFFDTAGRSSADQLAVSADLLAADLGAMAMLNAIDGPIFVLDSRRQVVATNVDGADLLARFGHNSPLGLRLGEGVGCVHAAKGPDGCGTGIACRHCGLGMANRQFGLRPAVYDAEFHLRSRTVASGSEETASTFHAHVAPLIIGGSLFRLCALTDVSGLRSREALEQIFFHDVLNTAQAVQGAATLIPEVEDPEALGQLAQVVGTSATTLVGEIEAQRDLLRAQDGTLSVALEPVDAWAIVADVVVLYRHSRCANERVIDLEPLTGNAVVDSNAVFLSRCVANLIKNALEASRPGEHITVALRNSPSEVAIDVRNPAFMPEAVQAQVFQRFFSTKATTGRGLGTYSVKLLVTESLGGKVTFSSTPVSGTVFTIRLRRG